MDVYVERLYTALTDALRRSRPRPFEAPVTVAEIYQELVPYRVVRASLGFEMNADYEHAVLQLLAGAGGLTRLEPESAAAELRAELSMPNPNVGLFRKFAGCDVWIAAPADPDTGEAALGPEVIEQLGPWADAASSGAGDSVRLGDDHEPAASDRRSSEHVASRDALTADDASTPKSAGPGTNVDDASAARSAGNREGGHTTSAPTSPGGRDQSAGSSQAGWTKHGMQRATAKHRRRTTLPRDPRCGMLCCGANSASGGGPQDGSFVSVRTVARIRCVGRVLRAGRRSSGSGGTASRAARRSRNLARLDARAR